MVVCYDESVQSLLYRRSCRYTPGEVDASQSLDRELVESLQSFMKRSPDSNIARACKESPKECTPEVIAEAIRYTCQLVKREQQEKSLQAWSPKSKEWFLKKMGEEQTQSADIYTATVGNMKTVSFISMTLLGVSSLYVGAEEKLVRKLREQGLEVDCVGSSRGVMWKAAYRPNLARADEIPVIVCLVHNEAAEQLWRGTKEFYLDGKALRATRVKIDHERSIKVRAKRSTAGRAWQSGKQGALSELVQLLSLSGASTGEIAEIFRQQLIRQCLPVLQVEPVAGMLLPTAQRNRSGQPQKAYIAVGTKEVVYGREVEWNLLLPDEASVDTVLQEFRASEGREGMHVTLLSNNELISRIFAAELLAEPSTSRNKALSREGGQDSEDGGVTFDLVIKAASSPAGRFSRKEMEVICGGGDTSVARAARHLTRAGERILSAGAIRQVKLNVDPETKSWDGSKITMRVGSKEGAEQLLEVLPLSFLEVKLKVQAANFQPARKEQVEQSIVFELERITMECCSTTGDRQEQLVSELEGVVEEVVKNSRQLEGYGAMDLKINQGVGELYETFYSPGNLSFCTLGEWVAQEEQEERNILKERVAAWLQGKRWTRVGRAAGREGSAFKAAGAGALGQEASELDDLDRCSMSLLFLAISKCLERNALDCRGRVNELNNITLLILVREEEMMEEVAAEDAGALPRVSEQH